MPEINDRLLFISYARQDEDQARAMRDRLSDAGVPSFMDTAEIRAGEDWRRVTTDALHRAALTVVVCTRAAIGSIEVTYEWAYAMALGVPVVPVVYEAGLELPGALAGLDRLNFTDPANRQWDRLVARAIEAEVSHRITLGALKRLGLERIFSGRQQLARRQPVDQLISRIRGGSELLVVGRSLETWAREFRALQELIDRRDVRIRLGLVDPQLSSESWLIPTDYAQLDLSAAIDKFRKITTPPPSSQGSFKLFFLPNAPVFSFTYYLDASGPRGILEFGASLTFDERFSIELYETEADNLLTSVYKVHDAMLSSRVPEISLPQLDGQQRRRRA